MATLHTIQRRNGLLYLTTPSLLLNNCLADNSILDINHARFAFQKKMAQLLSLRQALSSRYMDFLSKKQSGITPRLQVYERSFFCFHTILHNISCEVSVIYGNGVHVSKDSDFFTGSAFVQATYNNVYTIPSSRQ